MLEFEPMLQHALAAAGTSEVVLVLPFDLPRQYCRELLADGAVRGIVADSVDTATLDPACAGWWVDRERGQLHLRRGSLTTMVVVGVATSACLSTRLLLEARLKGIQRIVVVDRSATTVDDLVVERELLARIDRSDQRALLPSFERAFERMYALVGDSLRLPHSEFRRDRLALALGSLGPGGAERQGAYTAGGAVERRRLETYVLCSHVAPPADFFRPYVEERGAHVVRVGDSPPELDDPVIASAYRELEAEFEAIGFVPVFLEIVRYASMLRALRPAVVHSWMDYCNALCGTAATLVGVPGLLLSCRSVAPDHFRIFQPYMRPAYRALLRRRVAHLLNNSRAGAADYARWLGLPTERVEVIHNGFVFPQVDATTARERVRASLGCGPDTPLVGSILRFSEEKRPALLIDMAAELHRTMPAARFVFYGGGVQLEQMRARVRDVGLDGIVHVPGMTDAAWDVLAAMDVFVLASRMEGLPNVLVEAQASGLPVVTTGVGGMTETYVEGATGVTAEASATSLAASVAQLLADAARRARMGHDAQHHAKREFGIDGMIERTLAAYDRVLDAPAGHPSRKAA